MPNIKTAVSIPAPLFERADRMAREMEISRSEFFARAVEHYLRQRENEELLAKIDRACDGAQPDNAYGAQAKKRHRRLVEGQW
ncbi:MAG: ribbon-helix-helix protein, CopG family [Bacteroidota bacterium]